MIRNDAMARIAVMVLGLISAGLGMTVPQETMEFPYVYAFRGSTQEDAPALEIYLAQEPFRIGVEPKCPYLHIEVSWQDWSLVLQKDMALVPLSRHDGEPTQAIVRAEYAPCGEKPEWLKGFLRLIEVKIGKTVQGSVAFTNAKGFSWKRTFKADWVKNPPR